MQQRKYFLLNSFLMLCHHSLVGRSFMNCSEETILFNIFSSWMNSLATPLPLTQFFLCFCTEQKNKEENWVNTISPFHPPEGKKKKEWIIGEGLKFCLWYLFLITYFINLLIENRSASLRIIIMLWYFLS